MDPPILTVDTKIQTAAPSIYNILCMYVQNYQRQNKHNKSKQNKLHVAVSKNVPLGKKFCFIILFSIFVVPF